MAYKLIIADNSPAVLETLRLSFIDSGYDVYTFSNGDEVMKSIPHIEPDAFILGVFLKGKSGFEIGKYIRESEDYKDIPILFLIGAYKELDREKLSQVPYQGIFREPFDSVEVAQKAKSLIEGDNGLDTFPEEPAFDDAAEIERKFQKRLDAIEKNMTSKMRNMVKKEIYEAEKELEKRIKAAILKEMKNLDQSNKIK
ncbi:MAG: response regulator [Acidobacteriota bacterium]